MSDRALSEAVTMALYLSLVLAAEFVVLSEQVKEGRAILAAIWGTAIGLAFAHVFAFNLSERLFSGGKLDAGIRAAVVSQLSAALVVATALSIPVIVWGRSPGLNIAGFVVAGFVGVTAFGVGLSSGRSPIRSVLLGSFVLLAAMTMVLVKAALAGH